MGTVLPYTLYLQGVRDIGAVRASLISCVEPVTATICSTVWMHTLFMPLDLLGFAAILSAVCLLSVQKRTNGRTGFLTQVVGKPVCMFC